MLSKGESIRFYFRSIPITEISQASARNKPILKANSIPLSIEGGLGNKILNIQENELRRIGMAGEGETNKMRQAVKF